MDFLAAGFLTAAFGADFAAGVAFFFVVGFTGFLGAALPAAALADEAFPFAGFDLGTGLLAFTALAFLTTFTAFPVFAALFTTLPFGAGLAALLLFFAMIQR